MRIGLDVVLTPPRCMNAATSGWMMGALARKSAGCSAMAHGKQGWTRLTLGYSRNRVGVKYQDQLETCPVWLAAAYAEDRFGDAA